MRVVPALQVLSEAAVLDSDIVFYSARVARDPEGALDRARLGALYLQRARQTGSPEDLARAEQVARESFGIRTRKNNMALQVLTFSLLGQHRFAEALQDAETLVADDSASVSNRSMLGEIQMELGHYEDAAATFRRLDSWGYTLTVAPRLARWKELTGRPDSARAILLRARDDAMRQPSLPLEQKAWFALRLGDLAFRSGHARAALGHYQEGLKISPDDYRLLAAMTHLEVSRGRWQSAIRYGERAISLVLDPATLGWLGDAYGAQGDSAQATEYYHTLERVVLGQPGAYHRAWSLFLLDHDRQVSEVLAKVQEELIQRQDIYGYDLLAWALYKNGRYPEAQSAMRHALRLGTLDAQIFFHAGMIEQAAGDQVAARQWLRKALQVNPGFDYQLARVARQMVEE
jgi:tetratricopeptide (TPR) repeat protein